jgi:hypothetical protein
MPIPIDVPLREKRTYIQSASLFDFLVDVTGVRQNLNLSFRRKIECEIEAVPVAEVTDVTQYPARFSGEGARGNVDLVMVEKAPLRPIERRESYNEPAVIADSKIDGVTITSEHGNGASAIDRIVALNKRMIGQTKAPGKVLVFSKIFLSALPANDARLRIVLKSHLGVTLFRSAIFVDDKEAGEIVFYGT